MLKVVEFKGDGLILEVEGRNMQIYLDPDLCRHFRSFGEIALQRATEDSPFFPDDYESYINNCAGARISRALEKSGGPYNPGRIREILKKASDYPRQ